MNEFPIAEQYLSSGSHTLSSLSTFFKFYKSLHEDLSTKLSRYLSEHSISEKCKSLSCAMLNLFTFMQSKVSSNLDFCK